MNHLDFLDSATDYLNGNLLPQQLGDFESYLQTNAAARQELMNLQAFREQLSNQVQAETDTAWAALQPRLQTEAAPISWLALWRRWRMRLSLLSAIAVALVEAVLLVNAPVYRSINLTGNTRQIQIVFAPDAQQRQVGALLEQVHAQVSAGPGSGGAYTLSLPADEMDAALRILRATPLVLDAYPVRTQP